MRPCALLAPAGLVLLASGCPSRDISSLGHGDNGEILNDVSVTTNRDVDVLFLIDNSSSMNDKQDLVASNFPRFIDVLRNIPGGLPNLHIGIASSSVSVGGYPFIDSCSSNFDDGLLQSTARLCLATGTVCKVASSADCCSGNCTPDSMGSALGKCSATRTRTGCHIPGETCASDNDCCTHDCTGGTCGCPVPTGKFISDEANPTGGRTTNYGNAELEDVFTCIARLGVDGCGYEQHLEGMKKALDGSQPMNQGFLRDNAYLAVVILADEDDCSAKDPKVFDSGDLLGDGAVLSLLGPSGSYRCTEFGVKCDGMNLGRGAVKDYTSCTPRTDSYLQDPMAYVSFLRNLKGGDPTRVLVAVVAAPPTPFGVSICTDSRGMYTCLDHSCMGVLNGRQNVGDPGVRLNAFEKAFGTKGYFTNVCDNHYEMVLNDIANLIKNAVGNSCLVGDIDADDINPTEPGLQLNCEVSDAPNAGSTATEVVLPRCHMKDANTPDLTTTPCWWAKTDANACPASATHTAIFIERNNAQPPVGTHVAARCATKEGSVP